MGLTKVVIEVGDLGPARELSRRLGDAEFPAAVAVTMFEIAGTHGWRVEAYYEDTPDAAALLLLSGDLMAAGGAIAIEAVPDENWVAISQAALPPVEAGRFLVHGSHDRARVGFRLNAIEIDAGEAFGTAHHATTQGCLDALDRFARRRSFRHVLDLGCGSGVLAIAAARLLPKAQITASDIDVEAVRVAAGNVAANRAGGRIEVLVSAGLDHPDLRGAGHFDLVLANILAGPLIHLAPDLRAALEVGGLAVLSGILAEQAREVQAAFVAAGFSLKEKRITNGWATLVLERR